MKLETASWWAQLHRADSATSVWVETGRSVVGRLAAGSLATPSTALRRNIYWCRTPRRTWRRSPDELADEQVVLLADIASTGISAAESANLQIGDSVAVFAQGPIGLCATAGAKLKGASLIIAVESDPVRTEMSKRMGADVVLDFTKEDVVESIKHLTRGRGVDVAVEALGTQSTFESALRVLRPGGTLSSLGVYSGKLSLPAEPFAAGLGDHKIVTTLCPGGKERMRRLMELVRHGRLDLTPLLTHTFALDQINETYQVFAERRNGVIKVAIRP